MENDAKHIAMLLATSIIWGFNFLAQNDAAQYINPFAFMFLRTLLASITLIPLIVIYKIKFDDKTNIRAGIIMGICLFLASTIQQYGIPQTSIAKAGFIGVLYIVFIPAIEFIVFNKKPTSKNIICIILSLSGLFLLFNMELSLNKGDILILISTIFYSLHMFHASYFSSHNGIVLSFIQFITCAILSLIGSFFMEAPSAANLIDAAPSIIYAGVLSSGVAYTLQIIGQQKVDSTISAICLSLESAFATLFGYIFLHQTLSLLEIIGCALMLLAVILSQISRIKINNSLINTLINKNKKI